MAIGGYKTRTVLTKFEADASGYFKEVDKVNSKNKDAKSGFTSFAKGINDGINTAVAKLGALNQAFEGVIKIVQFSRDAIKGWGEDLRMEAANAGRSIDRLAEAAQGLVDDDSLNKFAARASSGALKLTQQQLETVASAAVALRERGFETKEALDALTEAAVTGRTRGLKPLGIEVEEGASKFQTATNLMAELNKVIADSHGPISQQADDVDRLAVAWDNAWDSAKNYLAQATLAVAVDRAKSPAEMRRMLQDQAQADWMSKFTGGTYQNVLDNYNYQQGIRGYLGGHLKGRDQQADLQTIEMPDLNVSRSDSERKNLATEAAERAARAILNSAIAATDRNVTDVAGKPIGFSTRGLPGSVAGTTTYSEYGVGTTENDAISEVINRTGAEADASLAEQGSRESRYGASQGRRNDSYLAGIFGPIDEFDAYATAFGTLQVATQSAMQAWISGSMSLGLAVKKGIGDALGALASQLAMESLKHGAFAIGHLAFGDFAGAATHGAAAAAFGVGAVAAAAAAKKLGGSVQAELQANKAAAAAAAAPPKQSSSSGGSASGGNGGSGDVNYYTIVYGETFYSESVRMQGLDADRFVKRAVGSSYVEHN